MPKKPLILCVDDEPEITKALSFLLEDDFQVMTTNSPIEALKIFKKHPKIKLIISDQRMPNMDGCTLLKNIMGINPDTYRMIISGYADARELMPNIEKGIVHKLLTKPWEPEILLTLVKSAVEKL